VALRQIAKHFIIVLFLICAQISFAQFNLQSAEALIKRLIPDHAAQFAVENCSKENGQDVFEVEARSNRIVLRGTNGVSIASALYYYLTNYCHAQITWNGTNLHLPKILPKPETKIHKSSPYEYRYYMNYCTFNYSMSWWNWDRWEKEIDWMAIHGINMPLAITGEEYTWYLVYKQLGFSDDDLKDFFCGPSYFAWFWMGNLDGWGGPLSLHWMKSHLELQKKILERERELGMRPVLPAFTGHVPAAFQKKFPHAKLKTTNWNNGFDDTYILDAEDPLFAEIGKKFLQKQTQLLGTDHLYSADTFNENEPPSDEQSYLGRLSAKVYEGMHDSDSLAIWVMQGWLFYSDRKFWKAPQTEALLKAVPNNGMIILDLATEIEPVWKRTEAFYGKPWIWNMLNNFGGNTNLFGRMETVANEPANALADGRKGDLRGIGLTMEGIEQNPVIYELMMDHVWSREQINLHEWLPMYVRNRYGVENKDAVDAWTILRKTVYSVPQEKYIRDGAESIIQARPTLDSFNRWAKTKLNYNPKDLLLAWDAMINAASTCSSSDGFQFDLIDVTRQVLANYALPLQRKIVTAYQTKKLDSFHEYTNKFTALIEDMDRLLATRKDFLLGRWIADARKWGMDEKEKSLYEMNAKDLITLWGDQDCPLNEYACRQWSGLLNDFYKPRWIQFFSILEEGLGKGNEFDVALFTKNMQDWEWKWVNSRKDYPVAPIGDPVSIARQLHDKYRKAIENDY